MILQADSGTENSNIAFLQDKGMDSYAKEKSFTYRRSTANQVSYLCVILMYYFSAYWSMVGTTKEEF